MLDAKKTNKFEIRKMERAFIDMVKLVKDMKLVKRTVNGNGEKIQFRVKVRQIIVKKIGFYEYKHSLKEEDPWKEVCLLPKSKGKQLKHVPQLEYLPLVNRPLKGEKVQNIQELLRYIPEPYQPFYTSIEAGDDDDDENDTSSDSDENE